MHTEEYRETTGNCDTEAVETSPSVTTSTSNLSTEPEANALMNSEVLPSVTPEVQYQQQTPTNGPPPPHAPDVNRPVFSPRPHMTHHATPNMYTMPPPGHAHGGPPPPPPNMYQQAPPPPSHMQAPGPTVYVANCHVNVGAFGGGQPQGGALIPNHHHQPPTHPPTYPPYIHVPEQPQHVPIKNMHDNKSDYDPHHRQYHQGGNMRGYRERGRGRGRGKARRREEHERSNSVSSDHSSYGDGGKHYKDNMMNVPSHFPGHMAHGQLPYSVQYSLGVQGQYMVPGNLARSAQGPPLMYTHPNQPPPQFMPGHYHNQGQNPMLTYPHIHPSHMQHIPDSQHPVMPQPLAYSQGSPMMPPQSQPHQAGVYMGPAPAENNAVVSLAHEPMGNANDVNHSSPMVQIEDQVDVNVSSAVTNNSPVMQAHDNPPPLVQPQPVYVEPTTTEANTCANPVTNTNITTSKCETQANVSVPTTAVVSHNASVVVSVTVTQVSQTVVSEAQQTPRLVEIENEISEPKHKVVSNVSTPISNASDTEIAATSQPQSTPIIAENKNNTATVIPTPVSKATLSTETSTSNVTTNSNINSLIVDMSTKLQIASLPSKGQDIGDISFMEEATDISIDGLEESTEDKDLSSKQECGTQPVQKPYTSPSACIIQPTESSTCTVNDMKNNRDDVSVDVDPSKSKSVEEVPEVAPSPPGGAWAQKKIWSKLFKPNEDPNSKRVAYVTPFVSDVAKSHEDSPAPVDFMSPSVLPDHPIADADIDKARIGGNILLFNFLI